MHKKLFLLFVSLIPASAIVVGCLGLYQGSNQKIQVASGNDINQGVLPIQLKPITVQSYNTTKASINDRFKDIRSKVNNLLNKVTASASLYNINKERIPYLISESEITSYLTNLPPSSVDTHYWIDIDKNNDLGTIDISVVARSYKLDPTNFQVWTFTQKRYLSKLAGFQKFSSNKLMAERTVRILAHQFNWLKHGYRSVTSPTYHKHKYRNSTYGFVPVGSGFVLHKDKDLPKYYIATAKHVVNAQLFDSSRQNINYHKLGQTPEGSDVLVSPTDAISNNKTIFASQNLRGVISIGDEISTDIGDSRSKTPVEKYSHTLLDFKKPNSQTLSKTPNIKEIKVVSDYSNVFNEKADSGLNQQTYYQSLNKDWDKLPDFGAEKITQDLVILSVEFNDTQSDLFHSWWSTRPSQTNSLRERDLFASVYPTRAGTVNTEDREVGDKLPSKMTVSSFPGAGNICNNSQPSFSNNLISELLSWNTPYWHDSQYGNKYAQNTMMSKLHVVDAKKQPTQGSSGAPVFNKNLEIVGSLWGGKMPESTSECVPGSGQIYNMFSWLSVSEELQKFFGNHPLTKNMTAELLDKQKAWKTYSVLNFDSNN